MDKEVVTNLMIKRELLINEERELQRRASEVKRESDDILVTILDYLFSYCESSSSGDGR